MAGKPLEDIDRGEERKDGVTEEWRREEKNRQGIEKEEKKEEETIRE